MHPCSLAAVYLNGGMGFRYAANGYVEVLQKHKVQISIAAWGSPEKNPYAVRVIHTIKEDEVDLSEYEGFPDAMCQTGCFIEEVYQRKRIHSSLGYLTPPEFENAYQEAHAYEEADVEHVSTLGIA